MHNSNCTRLPFLVQERSDQHTAHDILRYGLLALLILCDSLVLHLSTSDRFNVYLDPPSTCAFVLHVKILLILQPGFSPDPF